MRTHFEDPWLVPSTFPAYTGIFQVNKVLFLSFFSFNPLLHLFYLYLFLISLSFLLLTGHIFHFISLLAFFKCFIIQFLIFHIYFWTYLFIYLFVTFFTYFNYTISKEWQELHQESIILQKKKNCFVQPE
jgi:hypothetical protein